MSRVRGHVITRPLQRYNIEARTERVLDKDPKPAPKYASDVKAREKLRTEHPEIVDAIKKKDDVLNERLKKVEIRFHNFVTDIAFQMAAIQARIIKLSCTDICQRIRHQKSSHIFVIGTYPYEINT